jgi:hypothetical protein
MDGEMNIYVPKDIFVMMIKEWNTTAEELNKNGYFEQGPVPIIPEDAAEQILNRQY